MASRVALSAWSGGSRLRAARSTRREARSSAMPRLFGSRTLTSTCILLALSTLLIQAAAGNGTRTGDDFVDGELVWLDDVLQQVLAGLVRPAGLREHVQAAAEMKTRPELQASAMECDLSLLRWAEALGKLEMWALQMLDSSSKLVTGVLYGNLADLGNFDECVASGPGGPGGGEGDFTGRYVLPSIDVLTLTSPTAGSRASKASKLLGALRGTRTTLKTDGDSEYAKALTLRFAFCVPSTCRPGILAKTIDKVVDFANARLGSSGVRLHAELPDDYTAVAGGWRQPDFVDWFMVFVCVALVLLLILGTSLDLAFQNDGDSEVRRRAGFLIAFSAWSNGRRLLTVAPPSDTHFTCINGLRFFSAAWVVIGHRYRYILDVPYTNLAIIPDRVTDISAMAMVSAPLSVDTFFFVGGLVNCFSFMRAVAGRRSFNFFTYYLHRYIRLTPAFALMMGLTASWVSLIGSGPLWTKIVGKAANRCRDNWWTGLLYIGNYVHPNEQCMMQSWYLMADMHFHWLSPILLYPLWKYRRAGLVWVLFVVLVTCAIPFAVTYVEKFRSPVSSDLSSEVQDYFMKKMYFPTHTRATSYVCGMLAGYFLFLIKSGKWKRSITRGQVVLGWLLCTVVCLAVVFGVQPLYDVENHPYDVLEASFYMGFYRLGWSAGMAWITLACIFGHGGPVNSILSWSPLATLGRLAYGIYLTHAAVQIVDLGTTRTSYYYSDFKIVKSALSDVLIATILGTCLCLLTEYPILEILKAMRSRPRKSKVDVMASNGCTRTQSPRTLGALRESKDPGVYNFGFVADDNANEPSRRRPSLKEAEDAEESRSSPCQADGVSLSSSALPVDLTSS